MAASAPCTYSGFCAPTFLGPVSYTHLDVYKRQVEYIEAGAFNGCTALTELNIPLSVGYIKTGAFKGGAAVESAGLDVLHTVGDVHGGDVYKRQG